MDMLVRPNRRRFMGMSLAGGALIATRPAAAQSLFPVVETTNGKLRGMMAGGIAKFLGVRYAAPTSGANRFRSPQPVEARGLFG